MIADCNMPLMNGYELTRAIRQTEHDEQRPPCTVLGFTANAQPEEKQRCLQAGMNDCLFKPIGLTTLSQRLEALKPIIDDQTFNVDGLQLLTGGDPKLVQRLLVELLNSNRLDRQELLALPPANGPQAFIDMAHKIKGAARIVQASRLIDGCEALERLCHEDFCLDQLEARSKGLEHAMLELEQALQRQIRHHSNV
ncbi:hypothetical protein BLL42_22230 [Pseudomonas frederiksbergensis]|uniref:Histidine kinase n=1 Tax=Pseudomonas frederiksbergensis TaxID=104087 RepID=A0A1J0EQ79_9PSED|nr:hypothetical protein BLL42_22230 [Pseudomonas frederiksbergensis]